MPRQDSIDFLTAFAVGTALGIGATLLLQPEQTPKDRVIRSLKPYRKRMGKSYRQASSAMREGASATGDLTSEVVHAGRELLSDFRDEVADILGDARSELQEMIEDQVSDVSKRVKKRRRQFGG